MFDAGEIIVFMLGLFVGSGVVLKRAGPFIFYYIMMPIIGAVALVLILEQIPIPGIDFRFDRFLPAVLNRQGDLVVRLAAGLMTGAVLHWIARRLFMKKDRRKKPQLRLIDPGVSMDRKKCLAALGLTNSAGPREIMMAWTRLSRELQSKDWPNHPQRRGTDVSREDYKKHIDAAYNWLRQNTQEARQERTPVTNQSRAGFGRKVRS